MSVLLPEPARIAIIGVSGYGSIHLQLARESRDRGEIKITAATIINPQEEAATIAELRGNGAEIFTEYPEMFRRHAGKIDLCLIPTGIHWHARMTIAALEAGANVLVEKPLAGSVAEVEEIRRVERRTGDRRCGGSGGRSDRIGWRRDGGQQGEGQRRNACARPPG